MILSLSLSLSLSNISLLVLIIVSKFILTMEKIKCLKCIPQREGELSRVYIYVHTHTCVCYATQRKGEGGSLLNVCISVFLYGIAIQYITFTVQIVLVQYKYRVGGPMVTQGPMVTHKNKKNDNFYTSNRRNILQVRK